MLLGRTLPCSSDRPDRLYCRVLSNKSDRGKSTTRRFYTKLNGGGEGDLCIGNGWNYCQQGARFSRAYNALVFTGPHYLSIATFATGWYKHGSVTIWFSGAPSKSTLDATSGKTSPWLSAVHKADALANTFQSLSTIGFAGSHFVHERLTQLASWAGLTLSAVGLPKRSAGSVHSEVTTEPSRLTERNVSHPRAHNKRRKRDDSGNSQSGDNEEKHGAKSKSKRRREAEGTRLNLACPFAKKDPVRWRTCYRHELSKISYVKQHLYRVHLQPLYCQRCGVTYQRQEDLSEHMRSTTPCELVSFTVPEGLTMEQRRRLSERLSSKLTDEERWYAVFEIVFPGHPHPATPYVDPDMSEDLSSFRDHIAREGPRILAEECRRAEGTCSSLEATMRRGLEQISSSWFSYRSSYVNQSGSPRRRRSPTATSQIDDKEAAEAPKSK